MHLIDTGGRRILLDCGLFQGRRQEARRKNENFPLDAKDVDAVVLSHAHIDHAGRLPILVKRGYTGPIYCTPATRDLCAIMLPDSGHIQEKDFEFLRKRGHDGLAEPLYTAREASAVIERMVTVPYEQPFEIAGAARLTFTEAGHILGSASVRLDIDAARRERRIVFSGDIGRSGLPIIRDPKPPDVPAADALIVESTYAGRVHESVDQARTLLASYVETAARRGGKIFIPAFAVGRTQEIIYALHELHHEARIPEIPVFVDSPLAVSATDVFRGHPEALDRTETLVSEVSDVFRFPRVSYVRTVEESKALNERRGPLVVIAASGMAENGRILHHLRNGLGDHRNMVLIVGWQASYTLGHRLQFGEKQVRIFGEEVTVRAEVRPLPGYSAHGDRPELRRWIEGLGARPRRAFAVHGEQGLPKMAELLSELGVSDVNVPELGHSVEI
jgi:metallo-beta-lactamase family protein